ncbi:CinA family nicotinamide mononucleotide deamidase-related protein [Ereboglobus luteus]|uniref:CinA-like protein n=1 Tax=Ereboglobus luteus TaxID=1796921 RepID=A0A2U8DZK2_9BACT|nr:CinA family nicotinamide mononucleotide deamidase-related protein [Ereboglobus luteus]AWI08038.1 damage-inducible protein CinA [Ereboglobus luteus]
MRHFELLTLGDELLLGLVGNSHVTFIGSQLARRGVMLQRNITLGDDAGAIARQFAESWRAADVVITTGGLGPTCDDRTREAVARELGQKLVHDENVERALRERFERFGMCMTANNLKQAQRPERAEILHNPNGTAPGLWVEQDGKVLCMLPGPPNELRPMFTEQVMPRLARLGFIAGEEAYVQMRTIGVGESLLETKLQPVFDSHGASDPARLSVAYCAHPGAVDCRISSPGGLLSRTQLENIACECTAQLGENLLCVGHDELPRVVARLLVANKRLLAIAEDATGGMLANCFNDIPELNHFFAGAAVCHTHESKMQLIDVPEEVLLQHDGASDEGAIAMATGAAERMGADYALAITGFEYNSRAGNEHGGPVHIGMYSPHGAWAKTVTYPGPPLALRQRALTAALDWLRRELLKEKNTQS